MGKVFAKAFGGTTRPGVKDSTGTKYYDSPAQASGALDVAQRFNRDIPINTSVVPDQIPTQPVAPDPGFIGPPPPPDQGAPVSPQSAVPFLQSTLDAGPKPTAVAAPSFLSAGTDPYGNFSAKNPALTKKGKLFAVLLGAGSGAAAAAGSRTFGEGFQTAQAMPFLQAQRKQAIKTGELEQQKLVAEINNVPFLQQKTQAEIEKDRAETANYNSQSGKREKTPAEIVAERKAVARQNGLAEGTPEYNQYVFGVTKGEPQDKNPTDASLAWEASGHNPQKALQILKSNRKASPSAADKAADEQAQAEIVANGFLDHAKGDPEEALKLFEQAGKNVTDKNQLSLGPKIRQAIRSYRTQY